MSQLVQSPLQSYELMHYAVGVPCIICDGENRHDADRCRHCFAPLALTYQSEGVASKSLHLLAVFGTQSVGKTSYLGMLCDDLARRTTGTQAVFRGAFSVALQQSVVSDFTQARFPAATPEEPEYWNWNHLQLNDSKRRRTKELLFPDIAGVAIEDEIEHRSAPAVRAFFGKCSGAIVLLDTDRIEQGNSHDDFFGMKLLTYLSEMSTKRRQAWARKPIAFVFTKADCSSACFESPDDYAKLHIPGTYRQAKAMLNRVAFFATSVAGATVQLDIDGERRTIPLRIEPRRIREPFDWLLQHLR